MHVAPSPSPFEVGQLQGLNSLISEGESRGNVRPIFLEVCAGSAILSYYVHTLSNGGVQTVPVDHAANKHAPKMPILKIDLRNKAQVQILLNLVKSGSVAAAHFAVPCGTCSRAREIELPGGGGPRPLRSPEFPLGLDGLTESEQARVDCANAVYDSCFDLIDELIVALALILLENPDRSLFWCFPRAKRLLELNFVDVRFQHCKWTLLKSMRAKWVRLRTNCKAFQVMDGPCHVDHLHLNWGISDSGQFNTSFEAEYPPEMAAIMADIITSELAFRGYSSAKRDVSDAVPVGKKIRASTSKQPRGKAIPELISEFSDIVYCTREEATRNGSKILRTSLPLHLIKEGGVRMDAAGSTTSSDRLENNVPLLPSDEVVAGVFRTPEEFVSKALELKHPVDTFLDQVLPAEIVESIAFTFRNSPCQVAAHRTRVIRELVKLVKDHENENQEVIGSMDPFMKTVMAGKKLHTLRILAEK